MTHFCTAFYALAAAIALVALPARASTPIYKCVNESGKVTYSESPCYGERWHRFGQPEAAKPKAEPVSQPAAAANVTPEKSPRAPRTAAKMPTPP